MRTSSVTISPTHPPKSTEIPPISPQPPRPPRAPPMHRSFATSYGDSRAAHQLVQHLLHVPQPPQQLRVLRQRSQRVASPNPALGREHARRRLGRQQHLAAILETNLDGAVGKPEENRVLGAEPVLDVRQVRAVRCGGGGGRSRDPRGRRSARQRRLRPGNRRRPRRARVAVLAPGRVTQPALAPLHRAPPVRGQVPAEVPHQLHLLLESLGARSRRGEARRRGRHSPLAGIRTLPPPRALAVLQKVTRWPVVARGHTDALAVQRGLGHLRRVVEDHAEGPVGEDVAHAVL
mmetsp:Transcript_2158/g.9811  ORF Transcript_2158/g.9811 Transcript_2158/m.9811 type:complete len:291 (+) Transcript_2158:345-1217(+)